MKLAGSFIIFAIVVCTLFTSCKTKEIELSSYSGIDAQNFKGTVDGKKTDLFLLSNGKIGAAITNYGGRVVGLLVPDKEGKLVDVSLGMAGVKAYEQCTEPYFGALIGRVGNRIANGNFSLDGKEYQLFKNNGPNTLHGGKKGFQYVVWDADQLNDSTLKLNYLSKDGEENFPGNLSVEVIYSLRGTGLDIQYKWSSDARTVANLTNHAFFNLNGEGSGTIINHQLMINADTYTPVDETLIPTGELAAVLSTPFDFNTLTEIGERIDTLKNEQLLFGKGYDHNYKLNRSSNALEKVAKVIGDKSGIVMDVLTTEPGLQFYSGNFMQSKNKMKNGSLDDFRTAFCLETQHFPDAPNQPGFPSIIVEPGREYSSHSVYSFGILK
ncbi:aldose epimerase family protein [Plebeiibacterium marinum]|uniref:Aldose 1-epimerase n=1 Tax=Plebeiibacterium marinum TaxID=2992111 RepID=A0AAE3MFY4_9BACT|nr:aldose epimerase family protein [Plebeiobacterium marinum]MCW3806871.1 galactose mutarotase [Plebeiobacterium marinum]